MNLSRFLALSAAALVASLLTASAVPILRAQTSGAVKAFTGSGTPLRGGLPSGHAAVAFSGWVAVTLVLHDSPHRFLVSTLTFIMAFLVAQTRVETGVHSAFEVTSGGLIGALMTLALFQVFG